MSAPRPVESDYLAPADAKLHLAIAALKGDPFEARLQLLEACSARFGGFDLHAFQLAFGIKTLDTTKRLIELASPISAAIEATPIHPALALSALARESLDEADRKSTGAYHTDFRLAQRLAELAAPRLTHRSRVIDPACGAGILLAALSIAVCGRDRAKLTEWLSNGVCAADLSKNSLRAAVLALASLTDDVKALSTMRKRWLCGDSLLADMKVWEKMAPSGFDAVIGNPPWEKVKLSRHEFLKSMGAERHYGSSTKGIDEARFTVQRDEVASYSRKLLSRYPDLANGEPDLYIAFTSLFLEICRPDGVVAALVPGGLIRSQGTKSVRQKLIETSSSASISIIDNRARFFSIDTRFKFLAIAFVKSKSEKAKRDPITLTHERGTPTGVETFGSAIIGRAALAGIRIDLSLPEVKSQAEWKVFQKIAEAGCSWDDPSVGWNAKFCREVDMTKERPHFLSKPTKTSLPLIEGRMVHHHRFGVKGHASGTGRRAVWEASPIGASKLRPQFWIDPSRVPPSNRERALTPRVGFCDIAGQTNERSLMAALIPAGVVCGNKVPTIVFTDDPSRDRLLVWAAVANSFAFDWMLRRVLTTTVNYFLLQSIPLPRIAKDGLPWKKLVACASELIEIDTAGASKKNQQRMALLRAEIDAEVAVAYGLEIDDFELMLADFPILDRGQPALPTESKSTITRDTALALAAKRMGSRLNSWDKRAREAREIGAQAYVPSEIAGSGDEFDQDHGVEKNG
jgi:Alw26I/Eco31I/Esp3I family type II restriction m6 adenine DNA methyltransferase